MLSSPSHCHTAVTRQCDAYRDARRVHRYLRARASHAQASRAELWLGSRGPLTDSGILQVLRRRGAAAGLPKRHP
ncbi:MAG: hypothetical protein ACYDAN_13275, partial [Candidatus Limnocylindrales bacterium]